MAFVKGIFKWVKGDRGAGNASSSTQRVTLASDGAGVTSLNLILTSQTFAPVAAPVVTIAATSTAMSSPVNSSSTKVVVTLAGNDGWIALGSTPTAAIGTAGSHYLAEGVPRIFNVTGGSTKIAVIGGATVAAAGGYMSVSEFS
jgi:hypothetical protein